MPFHTLKQPLVDQKIATIQSSLDQTCIVTDFDGTLTQYFDHNGKSRPSIISLLYNEWMLEEDYTQQAQAMQKHYIVIEHDASLSFEIRQAAMEEWWTKHKELLMQKWLNYKHLEHITTMNRIVMRPGTDTLLQKSHELNIPVVIFSASGIGVDSIQLLLKHWNVLLPNISIVSNKLYRWETGEMIWYSKPVIHSLNKTEAVLRENAEYKELYQTLQTKHNIIVIWDGIGDTNMVERHDDRTVLTVGLCNDKVEERISHYEKIFDMVITHDDGFEELIDVIFQT